jgi:hypothetical protein
MAQEDILRDVWYFWNHSFYNRIKPSRKIFAKGKYGPGTNVYEVNCHDCGKTVWSNNCVKRNTVLDNSTGPSKTRNSSFICKSCYKLRRENLKKKKEKEYTWHRREKVEELMDSVEKFDDLMFSCEYNTCDILAAHRELLKDDDNRLSTDFMLGLICGEEKKKKYLESMK